MEHQATVHAASDADIRQAAALPPLSSHDADALERLSHTAACLELAGRAIAAERDRVHAQMAAIASPARDPLRIAAHTHTITPVVDWTAAAAELRRRGHPGREIFCQEYDTAGMREALEALDVDVSGFARPGMVAETRVRHLLGDDMAAFTRIEHRFSLSQRAAASAVLHPILGFAAEAAAELLEVAGGRADQALADQQAMPAP
jgi:hypothetical protein